MPQLYAEGVQFDTPLREMCFLRRTCRRRKRLNLFFRCGEKTLRGFWYVRAAPLSFPGFGRTLPHVRYIVIIHTIFLFRNSGYNQNILKSRAVRDIFDYGPMWETMKRSKVSQYQLLKNGIDNKTLDSLKKNGNITMATLEKLCRIIGCTPNDIVEFK